jgi:hypothetical protein
MTGSRGALARSQLLPDLAGVSFERKFEPEGLWLGEQDAGVGAGPRPAEIPGWGSEVKQ